MLLFLMAMTEDPDEREFLKELYLEYRDLMYWITKKYIENEQDRADIVHDSVVRLIGKVGTLRTLDRAELAGYIGAVVRNTAITFLKREQLHRQREQLLWTDGVDHTMEQAQAQMDDRALLLELGRRLKEEDRLLLEGKFLLELPDEQLAQLLGCKPASLRMRLHRTRCNLRALQDELEGGSTR